jgi:2-polyprenyl-6-methoxyphenol hydroxylase-like FAD-dependent oxidoreductase
LFFSRLSMQTDKNTNSGPKVAVMGAGLAGLILALALKKHCGVTVTVYEQAPRFGTSAPVNCISHHTA